MTPFLSDDDDDPVLDAEIMKLSLGHDSDSVVFVYLCRFMPTLLTVVRCCPSKFFRTYDCTLLRFS